MTPREEQDVSKKSASAEDAGGDPLLRALRELPLHAPSAGPAERRIHAEARAAFVRAFNDIPWYAQIFGGAGRAAVPVALASVVGLYLFWAFAAAIAINQ